MRHHAEASPLFKIGRGDSPNCDYDEQLDQYDENWDLRDVPLTLAERGGSHAASETAETELTQRRRGSLHHDEEEAVLCPLVFMADDDDSLGSQASGHHHRESRRATRSGAWRWGPVRRRGPPKRAAIGIGVIVCIAAALAFLAWFPTISEHAVSFRSSLSASRQLRGADTSGHDEGVRVAFPASIFQFGRAVSTALEALF